MENAERLKEELLADEFPAFVNRIGPYYKVLVGQFTSVDNAAKHRTGAAKSGIPDGGHFGRLIP